MAEISQYQWDIFQSMGMEMSGFSVPQIWSDPVATDPRNIAGNEVFFDTPTVFRQQEGFDQPTVIQTGFSVFAEPTIEDTFGFDLDVDPGGGFQGGPDGFDAPEPHVLNPGGTFVPTESGFDLGSILDPLGIFGGSGPENSSAPQQSSLGGLAMVMGGAPLILSRLGVAFNLIGRSVKITNGRIPMQKGFLSRIMQLGTGLTVANIFGIDLWPFNNSSDRDSVQDMVEEALESGAISDNRAYNRQTGTMSPMRAIIILYDRMGEQVEQMYAVSFRPANPATTARRTSRSNNVVRRRKTPQRRNS